MEVLHLLFANDALVFYEASYSQLIFLYWLLIWFEVVSVLKINLDKSELILVVKVGNVEDLTVELGCQVGNLQ